MSPIGGVGINLAIQDAVAAANILTQALLSTDPISIDVLKAVQKRREFSIRLIQRLQILIQNKFIKKVLNNNEKISPPLFIRIINYFPFLRRIPSRLIGLGIRPEFVKRK